MVTDQSRVFELFLIGNLVAFVARPEKKVSASLLIRIGERMTDLRFMELPVDRQTPVLPREARRASVQ